MMKSLKYAAVCLTCVATLAVPFSQAGAASELSSTRVPDQTVVSTHTFADKNIPYKAIDGDINTAWTAGKSSDVMSLYFREQVSFSAIQIATTVSKTTTHKYLVYGLQGKEWTVIARESRTIEPGANGQATVLDPIKVTPGTYEGILVSIDANTTSNLVINELRLVN
ncbi:discoidin domain-containing protein [Paenibacillus kandeliae]|uniref:discoidin domain-containing protein n=1 Tax=Paenibacillus kandeliae TaxID=3231269 RepID=UPI00345A778B